MSDTPSQDDISAARKADSSSTASSSTVNGDSENGAPPNWMAIKLLLGLTASVALFSLWLGDYTNAAVMGAIAAGAGCMARNQLLRQRGEDEAASRWKIASYVFYAVPVGYALYVFVL